jgi:methylthioribose-1-phosphate isomerase
MRDVTLPERSIWTEVEGGRTVVRFVDQARLPATLAVGTLRAWEEAEEAIRTMRVRGAPLIGVAGAYGLCLAVQADPSDASVSAAASRLRAARPTAVNLARDVDGLAAAVAPLPIAARPAAAWGWAEALAAADVATNRKIGEHGLALLEEAARLRPDGAPIRVLTHCNAGALATVARGTATSPIYRAHEAGMPLHVWVSETRPRLQGAALTAWELAARGIPHAVVVDGAAAHLLQRGEVDIVIVGTDRTTRAGDVCNKIGTYAKALAARAHGVPFHAAVPSRSIDWTIRGGIAEIPIEERDPDEVLTARGTGPDGVGTILRVAAPGARARNPSFDVTPAALVTGLITDRGLCPASEEGLLRLYPEERDR